RELFFETAQELLQALNDQALSLESQPDDPETVRGIRRTVHTLKGDAAACGYRELSELAHEMEDALGMEGISATALAELAFQAADVFGAMLHCYRKQTELPSLEPLRQLIRNLSPDAKAAGARPKSSPLDKAGQPVWTEYERAAIEAARKEGRPVYHIRA